MMSKDPSGAHENTFFVLFHGVRPSRFVLPPVPDALAPDTPNAEALDTELNPVLGTALSTALDTGAANFVDGDVDPVPTHVKTDNALVWRWLWNTGVGRERRVRTLTPGTRLVLKARQTSVFRAVRQT